MWWSVRETKQRKSACDGRCVLCVSWGRALWTWYMITDITVTYKLYYLFSPLGKLAERDIYFTFRDFFFLFFYFFFTMSKAISVFTGPIFMIFFTKWKVFAWIFLIRSTFFPITQRTLPWQPTLCHIGLFRSEPKYLRIRWTNFHNLCTIC